MPPAQSSAVSPEHRAEQLGDLDIPSELAPPKAEPLRTLYEEGRSMRGWGIASSLIGLGLLTAAGGVAVGCAIGDTIRSIDNRPHPGEGCSGAPAAVLTAVGALGVVAGLPLWIAGKSKMNEAIRRGYVAEVKAYVSPSFTGVVAGITLSAF